MDVCGRYDFKPETKQSVIDRLNDVIAACECLSTKSNEIVNELLHQQDSATVPKLPWSFNACVLDRMIDDLDRVVKTL
jgi:hypothetical protein